MTQYIQETAKSIPVVKETDVVVAGGGLSGVIAAYAAARSGADTMLIERFSCLGGVAVMGLPIQGYESSEGVQIVKGFAKEFHERLAKIGGAPQKLTPCRMHNAFLPVLPEAVKLVCQEMLLDAGVTVWLNTVVSDAVMDGDRIAALIVEGKSGRQAIKAKEFIDCTGDADVAKKSGAPFQIADDGELMANTLDIIFCGVDKERLRKAMMQEREKYDVVDLYPREQIAENDYFIINGFKNQIRQAAEEKEMFASLSGQICMVTLPKDDMVCVNSVHVSGFSPCESESLSEIEMRARKQAQLLARFVCEYLPGFENASVATTAPWAGIRESRIITGVKTLTMENIANGEIPDDTVALGGYPYDFHRKNVDDGKENTEFYKVPVYGIPYGCLVTEKVDNLFVAGKTISATREAMASSRVMAQCMAEGHAVGIAAAMCAKSGERAKDVDVHTLRQKLSEQGAVLNV